MHVASAKTGLALQVLQRYQSRRRVDNLLMQSGMDLFYAGFSNDPACCEFCVMWTMAPAGGRIETSGAEVALGLSL